MSEETENVRLWIESWSKARADDNALIVSDSGHVSQEFLGLARCVNSLRIAIEKLEKEEK